MYYNNYFAINNNNIKSIWRSIKEIVTLKKRKINLPTRIVHNNSILNNSTSIANAFNTFFSNVGKKLADKFQQPTFINHS